MFSQSRSRLEGSTLLVVRFHHVSIRGDQVLGTTDSHVEIERGDLMHLRTLCASLSGSLPLLPGEMPSEVQRLEQLGLAQVIGGRVFITGRGVCALQAEPISETGSVLTFRRCDLW